jgi:adenine deaminase
MIVLDDLKSIAIDSVYKNGRTVSRQGKAGFTPKAAMIPT